MHRKIKFSNLLKNDCPQASPENQICLETSLEGRSYKLEKLRRRSLEDNIQFLRQKKESGDLRTGQKDNLTKGQKNRAQIINTAKINKVLLQHDFQERKFESSKNKGKKVFFIRKKSEASSHSSNKPEFTSSNRNKSQSFDKSSSKDEGQRIIKKKTVFGLEDIDISIENSLKKKLGMKNHELFASTSMNSFFLNSFYLTTSKKREDLPKMNSPTSRAKDKHSTKVRCNEMEPEVIMLQPQKGNLPVSINRRRKIQKFYTTNGGGEFGFRRSKTDDVDLNKLCGWEEDDDDGRNGVRLLADQQFSDSFYI